VESRLRHLVIKLEFVENLVSAHPFIKGFDKAVVCHTEQEAIDAGRGIFDNDIPTESSEHDLDENGNSDPYERTVFTTTFYIGLAIEPRAVGVTTPRKLDISWPTSEYTKLCKQWERYDEKSMGICVKYIKR
jgi:poly(A) polymerase